MLETQIIEQHASFLKRLENYTLNNVRKESLKRFIKQGFPKKKKNEDYKYIDFSEITEKNFNFSVSKEHNLSAENINTFLLDHNNIPYKLIFINGIFQEDLSRIPVGITFMPFEDSINRESHVDFNTITSIENPFVALNTAYFQKGAFICVSKEVVIENPIEIVYFSSQQKENTFYATRNLIIVQEEANLEVIESHYNLDKGFVFTDSVTEIFVASKAKVKWDKLQNDSLTSYLVDNTFVKQERESTVTINTFSFGGKLIRNNLQYWHNGENINSFMNGITIINGEQTVDHNTTVLHNSPNCESFQNYKSVFDEKAHGIFNGKIYVHKDAQKTDAYQKNSNILLSTDAEIDTKPQLEIFADNVRCSHGCTVGQLDKESLFYLRSRGIPLKEAKKILLEAFAFDVINNTNNISLKNKIVTLVKNKLDM